MTVDQMTAEEYRQRFGQTANDLLRRLDEKAILDYQDGAPANSRGGTGEIVRVKEKRASCAATAFQETMTESAMRTAISDLVELHGGLMFYIRDSRQAPETEHLPDLLLILPHLNTVAFVELKSQKRRVTIGQAGVIAALSECHDMAAWIVRPKPRDGEVSYGDFIDWMQG